MSRTAVILELRRRTGSGIYAVPYRSRRSRTPQWLPDGAIVESPTPSQRREAPETPAACFEVAAGGGAATIHHLNLGLVEGLLEYAGVFVLPSGEVAAIYGAEAVPIDAL